MTSPHGILLAAGAGRRMGRPKALVRSADGEPWLTRGVKVLLDGGCAEVTVVLGAAVEEALTLLEGLDRVRVVLASDWDRGMSASLKAGLASLVTTQVQAAVVHLVDLPDVRADVVRRVLGAGATGPATLRRASYDGAPGHPVLLGREHWAGVAGAAAGDRGARDYLSVHAAEPVECADLATGADQDTPPGAHDPG